MKQNKKGMGLGQAFGAVLILVLVAVLVIIAIYLVATLQPSLKTSNTAGVSRNDTITAVFQTARPLVAGTLDSVVCGTITHCLNATTAPNNVIPADNYTQSGCTVRYSGGGGSEAYNGTIWKCTYPFTYTADTAASNASGTIITQFAAYPALIGLVGVIIFLALVIGVLVASFAYGGKKGA